MLETEIIKVKGPIGVGQALSLIHIFMEFYLNNVYFANGYYGIDAACHGYFNCELKDLDVSQTRCV